MQPESSDGLASVGTILPEEMAAPKRTAISVFGIATGLPGMGISKWTIFSVISCLEDGFSLRGRCVLVESGLDFKPK